MRLEREVATGASWRRRVMKSRNAKLQDTPKTEEGEQQATQVVVVQTRMLERSVSSIHYPQKLQTTRSWVKCKVKT